MRKLLDKATHRARKVTVASILPRPKRPDVQLKTDHVNEAVKKLCHENQAYEFVDNDGTFKLSDLTPYTTVPPNLSQIWEFLT